jgi:hypothetical protein
MKRIKLFFECLLNWNTTKLINREDLEKADVIFCQSFGPRKDSPGISNEFLANCIIKVYKQNPKKLIIQKDCADAFPVDVKIDKIIFQYQSVNKYLDSFEVSRQCAEYCENNNFKTILIFAHPHHVWRVKKTIEKFGLVGLVADTRGTPYDWKSTQIWTRTKIFFIPRELLTRLYYWLSNKI